MFKDAFWKRIGSCRQHLVDHALVVVRGGERGVERLQHARPNTCSLAAAAGAVHWDCSCRPCLAVGCRHYVSYSCSRDYPSGLCSCRPWLTEHMLLTMPSQTIWNMSRPTAKVAMLPFICDEAEEDERSSWLHWSSSITVFGPAARGRRTRVRLQLQQGLSIGIAAVSHKTPAFATAPAVTFSLISFERIEW